MHGVEARARLVDVQHDGAVMAPRVAQDDLLRRPLDVVQGEGVAGVQPLQFPAGPPEGGRGVIRDPLGCVLPGRNRDGGSDDRGA